MAAIVINTVPALNGDSGKDAGNDTSDPGRPSVSAPAGGSSGGVAASSGGPAPTGLWLSKATVAEVDDLVMSQKVLARRSGNTVSFLDPATGKDKGSMSVVAPAGVPTPAVQRVTLVDTADDTIVVFFYRSTYQQDGLNAARGEHRVQARLRSTGQQTLDTALTLGGELWEKSSWSIAPVAATDPGGYLVLNYLPSGGAEPNLFHVVGLLPGLRSWTVSEDCCPRSIAALAANGGVLLASWVGADDELRGYDLATGRQLWRRGYRDDSILNIHPDCARAHKGTFIVRDSKTPMILDARTGAVVRNTNGGNCLMFDSAGSTGVQTKGAVVGYDLDTGEALWTIASDRVRSLDLKVVGVYRGRVYVTTQTDRLVLDARTGTEVGRGWTVAPKAGYGSWVVGFDHPKRRDSVYPGTG
ncbi:hypothetical protein GCM10009557_39470 [Virgisporangium ochraceum]|uniref:Pyrrolo-quinoline quinone repeat domain-containing protein n=1 Tax=Virgisporangium ochraceum TaxID=65505 RepID=A0A8J4EEI9_9ACTN|nr:hypothetical protein Voc01_067310 [Virgisporangium ochraceum]